MSDRIERIVDRVDAYTRALLAAEPVRWPAARQGLERILGDLRQRAPEHAALGRLRRVIDDLGRLHEAQPPARSGRGTGGGFSC